MNDRGVAGARVVNRGAIGRLIRAVAWSVVALMMTSGVVRGQQISFLFQETFQVLGTKLNLNSWTTEIGASSGANVVWYLSGPTTTILAQAALPPVPDVAWQIAMAADVNGDGHPDLIWRNTTTGANVVWYLSGTSLLSQASLPTVADTNWILRP